jgi:predicted ATP-grasp superfamily ATP-dependent carboligase
MIGGLSGDVGYFPSRNDFRAVGHVIAETFNGIPDPAARALAVLKVHNLWLQYQAKLEAAREKKKEEDEEKINKLKTCASGKQQAVGLGELVCVDNTP